MNSLFQAWKRIDNPRLLVLGDLILDRYIWGNTQRVSPEAPVVVLEADLQEVRPGGAASVAALLRGLSADVALAGVMGDDANGQTLDKVLQEQNIERELVLCDPKRPTTTKERLIGRAANRHPHQIVRVDFETRDPMGDDLETQLIQRFSECVTQFDAVLVSDYGKGVCTPRLLEAVIDQTRRHGVPLVIDPSRRADYEAYRGASVLTPNRLEAEAASGETIRTPQDAIGVGQALCERYQLDAVLITLDSEGMVLVSSDGSAQHFETVKRSVYDVTGAGDMVLAIIGLAVSSGLSLGDAASLANLAAGLEVERMGVTVIDRDEITTALREQQSLSPQKQIPRDELVALVESYRRSGKKIVFTNGCFDLLHIGHVSYLQEAARLGDVLVVAVNSDASVKRLKGPQRPLVNQNDRAAMLASLSCVDHVLLFDEPTPHKLLRLLRPDVLVKGGTYSLDEVVGREVVEAYGGEIRVTGQIEGVSTTQLLSQLSSART